MGNMNFGINNFHYETTEQAAIYSTYNVSLDPFIDLEENNDHLHTKQLLFWHALHGIIQWVSTRFLKRGLIGVLGHNQHLGICHLHSTMPI